MREFVFQKLDGRLRLLGPARKEYADWVATLDEKECFVAKFTSISSGKTRAQCGYLYAGMYHDMIVGLRDLGWNECGHIDYFGLRIPRALITENVDDMMKEFYAASRGVPKPSKKRMSKAMMSDFIEFILLFASDNGICIRPPLGDDY